MLTTSDAYADIIHLPRLMHIARQNRQHGTTERRHQVVFRTTWVLWCQSHTPLLSGYNDMDSYSNDWGLGFPALPSPVCFDKAVMGMTKRGFGARRRIGASARVFLQRNSSP